MAENPVHVQPDETLENLEDVFDDCAFEAIPVVDDRKQLVGVVRREAVEEARGERSERALLRFGGLISGEELRSMGLWPRSLRRLAFLVPNVLLMVVSISVIAAFESIVLEQVIALAIFCPWWRASPAAPPTRRSR